MTEPKHLKEAKGIITHFKLQAQAQKDKSSSTKLTDLSLRSTASTDSRIEIKYQNIATLDIYQHRQTWCNSQYQVEFKLREGREEESSSVTMLSNPVQIQSESTKNVEIKNIINTFRILKEQKQCIEGDKLKNNSINQDALNDHSLHNKKNNENILNSSEDVIKNSQSNYLWKQNNKRLKTRHNMPNKQSNLTRFYNVVKSINNYEHARLSSEEIRSPARAKIIDKCEHYINDSKNLVPVKVNTNIGVDKTICRNYKRSHEFLPSRHKAYPKVNESHQITFDEFCRDIVTGSDNKLSKGVNKSDAFYKENTFLKSFSTGNITERKENHNHTNSLPMTSYELRCANSDLEKTKTTFDQFIEKILKEIKNNSHENINSVIPSNSKADRNGRDVSIAPYEKDGDKDIETPSEIPIIRSHIGKEFQASQHMPYFLHNSGPNLAEVNNTYNLPSRINILNPNAQDSKVSLEISTVQKCENSKRIENVSKTNTLNPEKNQSMMEEKLLESAKENSFDKFYSCTCVDENSLENTSLVSPKRRTDVDNSSESNSNLLENDMEKLSTIYEQSMRDTTKSKNNCVDENTNNLINQKRTTDIDNSLKSNTDLLENDLEKFVISTIYEQSMMRDTEKSKKKTERNNFGKLDNFLNKITNIDENRCFIKRYKKDKTKIYKIKRLRRLRKKHLLVQEDNKDLNVHDVLEKITNKYETQTPLPRLPSTSSISTSSSYITDNTKSDVLSTGSKELTSPQQRLRDSFNELSKDKSLCYSGKEWKDVTQLDKEKVKMKIQDIFFQVLDDFKKERTSYFKHKRPSLDNCIFKDGRLQLKPDAESSITVISSKAKRSKAKFQIMMYIMKKIETLLETDTKITKRELYYQVKTLINDQGVTDRAINSISSLLEEGMWAFNIIAQKGLVFGKLKLLLSSGEILNCNIPGTSIPLDINDIVEIHSSAYFILVVEKESIFHKLIEEDLPNKLTRPFIMITGKGFPDLNTQLFLRKLWMIMSIPVFILVDADPHGINIMLNYRFGSANNAHVSQHLAVPNAKWLGVYPSEVINLNIARQPLNEKEIKLVNNMLKTPYMEFSPRLVDELNFLLTKKYKAGIEGLIKTDSYLSDVYLPYKFFTRNFI